MVKADRAIVGRLQVVNFNGNIIRLLYKTAHLRWLMKMLLSSQSLHQKKGIQQSSQQ